MADSELMRRYQVGIEATPGTLVTATRRLESVALIPHPIEPIRLHKGRGSRFVTAASKGKGHTEGSIEGVLAYNEIGYLLGACLAAASGGTYRPTLDSPHDLDTLTLEVGNSVAGERAGYLVVNSLSLSGGGNEEIAVSGSFFARAMAKGFSLTNVARASAQVASAANVEISIGASVAGLSELDKGIRWEIEFPERFNPCFFTDADQASFSEISESRDWQPRCRLTAPEDADAVTWLAEMRAMTQGFCRFLFSDVFAGPVSRALQLTFPFLRTEADRGETDGLDTGVWTLDMVHDTNLSSGIEVVLT
jgi:hypothetical protein